MTIGRDGSTDNADGSALRRGARARFVTGIGAVAGTEYAKFASNVTVNGGTHYPLPVKKHLRAMEIALANRVTGRSTTVAGREPRHRYRCLSIRACATRH